MLRCGNLMPLLCNLPNIIKADVNARKGKKRSKKFIDKHDEHLLKEDKELVTQLFTLTFKTSAYGKFKIYEPKERLIFKLPYYPDRIVHHSIMNVVKCLWTRQFISNTYSCIEGRGIHKCLKDLRRDLRKTRNTGETVYCLKLDITKFYPSIDHGILKEILAKKIKDKRFLLLLSEIIDSINSAQEPEMYGKGVPIGNYLSQFFANLYLSPFDHWCKEELKCRYYYRYADDIVILSNSKDKLRNILVAIKLYLGQLLKLKVKGNYQIFPVESRGIDFIGYVFKHDYIKVRKSIKLRCKDKAYSATLDKLLLLLPAYWGWFKHCNSINLRRVIFNKLNLLHKNTFINYSKKGRKGKPLTPKVGVTKVYRRYRCGEKIKK